MDVDLIPPRGFLRDFVKALEPHSEAPAEGYLGGAIALLSACLGPQLRTEYLDDLTGARSGGEYGHVWILLLGPSAAVKKSTISRAVKGGIRAVQREVGVDANRKLRLRPLTAGRVSDAGIAKMLGATSEEEADDWYLSSPPGVLLDGNEIAPLFGARAGERDEKWAQDARHTLLGVYDGEISSDTIQTPVPRTPVAAAAFANATRVGLEERIQGATIASGFFARWIPLSVRATEKSISRPRPNGAASRLVPWWSRIAGVIDRGGIVEDSLSLYNPAAEEVRDSWYHPRNRALKAAAQGAEDGDGDPLAALRLSAFSRWQAAAHKLAVLHAASRELDVIEKLAELEVTPDDVAWGIRLADEALELLDRLLEAADAAPSKHRQIEDRIARHVGASKGGILTLRELRQKTGLSSEEIEVAVGGSELLDLKRDVETGRRGRKPTVIYLSDRHDADAVDRAYRETAAGAG